jgi:ABC-type multidrug transport system ATPase subunit
MTRAPSASPHSLGRESSEPEFVARYCTRVIGMRNGRVVYDGPPRLKQHELEMIYAGHDTEHAAFPDGVHSMGPYLDPDYSQPLSHGANS